MSSSLVASFIPPCAKFGRPPPFAPVALAISPTNGFANDMISIYHSGILADNSNIQTIQDAIEQVIQLWKNKRLDTLSSYDMYQMFAPAKVVSQYIKMASEE